MTLTTAERLLVNGRDMKTLARNVETLAATLRAAPRRVGNLVAAGRHGGIWLPKKRHAENVLTWPVWVAGCDEDGTVPGGSTAREEFFKNVDELIGLMCTSEMQQLEIKHYLPDGTIRVGYGEVQEAIDFTTVGDPPLGQVVFKIVMADPFWREDGSEFEKVISLGMAWTAPTEVEISELAGCNAPIEDAELEIWDPSDDMVIQSGEAAETSLTIDGNYSGAGSNEIFRVDSGRHRIYKSTYSRDVARTNRSRNPSLNANTTDWSISSGTGGAISRQTTGYKPVFTAGYGQSVLGSAGIFHVRMHPFSAADTTSIGYVVGNQYTWSVYARLRVGSPTASLGAVVRISFWTDTTLISSHDSAATTLTRSTSDTTDSGSWKRISHTVTVPATTTRVDATFFTGPGATGDILNFTGALIEEGAALNPFFDGDYPAGAWLAGGSNSRSQLWASTRQNVHQNPSGGANATGFGNNGGVGGAASRQTGGFNPVSRSTYLTWAAGSAGTVSPLLEPANTNDFHQRYRAGSNYTWSAYVRFRGVSDATRDVRLRAIFATAAGGADGDLSTALTALADVNDVNSLTGWVRLSVSGQIPATTSQVTFTVEAPSCDSGDNIDVCGVLVEPGLVLNGYFDGNTPGAYWRSTQYNSDSFVQAVTGPTGEAPLTNYEMIEHAGDVRYVYLAPNANGVYNLVITGTVTGSVGNTQVILRASRKFRTG